jgi:hypothetical protein
MKSSNCESLQLFVNRSLGGVEEFITMWKTMPNLLSPFATARAAQTSPGTARPMEHTNSCAWSYARRDGIEGVGSVEF